MLNKIHHGTEPFIPITELIDAASNKKLVVEVITEATAYIMKLVPALKNISTGLRTGDVAESTRVFTEAIDGLDWLAQLISILKERYGANFTNMLCNNIKVQTLESDLLNILTDIIPAQINKNWNLMADLLEHELIHNLNLWATVLPNVIQLEKD